MLDLLDSILAFSAVMLGVSLLVTVIVQGLSGILNLRGWALAQGLAELFAQAKIQRKGAANLANQILCHPLISDSTLPKDLRKKDSPWYLRIAGWVVAPWVPSSAIRKEELLRLLESSKDLGLELPNEVKDRLHDARIVVGEWFDGQMDRVSQTFTHATRLVTIAISFIIAFALHLDASVLLQRMFSDSETRAKLVASVASLQEHATRIGAVPSASAEAAKSETAPDSDVPSAGADGGVPSAGKKSTGAPSAGTDNGVNELRKAATEIRSINSELAASGIDILPKFGGPVDFAKGMHAESDFFFWKGEEESRHFLGIVAAGALLGLGAPFWFNLLSQLANLRTVLANKEKAERAKSKSEAG